MGVILPGVERDRDFPPVFLWDLDGKRLIFVGVGRERFENSLPCHPRWEVCWSPQAFNLFICSWLASRCSQRSPSQQRFPWALQQKDQILKEQITDGRIFFKMPFHPCPSGCGCFQSADDGHDHCLQCLGFQHAEDAFMDDSCACCGRMSMTSLWSRLSFLKGLAPSAATRASL